MLTFGIRYLCGSVVAGDLAERTSVEWPPHPARVFMALAAAHFYSGDDPQERAALEWLEQQAEPLITAGEAFIRPAVTSYVPVNDSPGDMRTPIPSIPSMTRLRQPRTFARAWLETDTVWLHWPAAEPSTHLVVLAALCSKVTRVGHSTSLVQMWATNELPPEPNWEPASKGTHELRIPAKGSLAGLEEKFNRNAIDDYHSLQFEAMDNALPKKERDAAKQAIKERFPSGAPIRLRPEMNLSMSYRRVSERAKPGAPGTVFDSRILTLSLVRKDSRFRQLGLVATLDLTARCREAVLSHLDGEAIEALTGHDPSTGGRSENPHLAILPLAFVGREHATGGILGLGFALPAAASPEVRQRFHQVIAKLRVNDLLLGEKGRWSFGAPDERETFRSDLWTGGDEGSDLWATVTPYVYDRHSKAKDRTDYQEELADSIRTSWARVKHPENHAELKEIIIVPVSGHLGAPPAYVMPRLRRKDASECRHCHSILRFDQRVMGPLLLGAGRYRGYGLCRPM